MYHRVCSVRHDPWGLAVTPEQFEEQVAYIKRDRTPLSMEKMVAGLRNKTLPDNALAITFDDGYRDNLLNAKPVLMCYGVPATVFIATGYTNRNTPFWWDELAAIILESTRSEHHKQECGGEVVKLAWQQPEAADITGRWTGANEPRTARQRTFLAIWRKLKYVSPDYRDLFMDGLRLRFETVRDPLAMPMSADEIRTLVSEDLVTIGAHTVMHSSLSALSRLECRQEILESREQCRAFTGKPINGFAYPYGDMSSEVEKDVTSVGFAWACSTQSRCLNTDQPNFYSLSRITAPNAPMRSFVKLITA